MPGLAWQLTGSAIGALAVLAAILILGARGNLGPERLLFAGIALNALCSAVLTAVIALGNMQSYVLLRWLSGSTSEAGTVHALVGLAALLVLSTPLLVLARAARATLVVIAALASAFAAMFVGPLSFIGLIAPHLARLFGLGRARQHLVGSVLLGALLMIASDWLSRMAAFPYQLPVGLFASLLGGPYLIYLLGKGVQRHG
jgi:iron complex transport system permease protein